MSDESKREAEREYQMDPSAENAQKLFNQKTRSGEAGPIVYAVVATSYDYNDEYYYTTEAGGYHVQKVYVSQARAQEECDRCNRKSLLSNDLRDWVSDGDTFFNDQIDGLEPVDFLKQYGIDFEEEEIDAFDSALSEAYKEGKINDQVLDKIYKASSLSFYQVETLRVEDGLCGEVG
jgi:hypothetical protein